jgi:hypothetical protein
MTVEEKALMYQRILEDLQDVGLFDNTFYKIEFTEEPNEKIETQLSLFELLIEAGTIGIENERVSRKNSTPVHEGNFHPFFKNLKNLTEEELTECEHTLKQVISMINEVKD